MTIIWNYAGVGLSLLLGLIHIHRSSSFLQSNYHRRWKVNVLNSGDSSDLVAVEPINRGDFPILFQEAHPGKPLIYLDSAASSQKPAFVINRMGKYYEESHSNVHRGAHALAVKATEKYEEARYRLQAFINAKSRNEIIFTSGATDAINIVALSYGSSFQAGDEIILSVMEHHSNLVPWQMVAQRTGAVLKFVELTDFMEFDMDQYRSLLSEKTKLVAISHASNVLGIINPAKEIIKAAHEVGAKVLLDACQSVPHMPVDVQDLDVDFLAFSAHKMCGPTGIGVLYGKLDLLDSDKMPPVQGGGEMIDKVELYSSTYAKSPSKFEAGTPAIAEAVGFSAACEYLDKIGMDVIHRHEEVLGTYLCEELEKIPGVKIYGPSSAQAKESGRIRTGLVAFNVDKIHSTDLSFFLDQEGVAIRTGHHCTQPLHAVLGASGSMRASVYFYNDKKEIDLFIIKLRETIDMFAGMALA